MCVQGFWSLASKIVVSGICFQGIGLRVSDFGFWVPSALMLQSPKLFVLSDLTGGILIVMPPNMNDLYGTLVRGSGIEELGCRV